MNFIRLLIIFTVCVSMYGCASIETTFNKPSNNMVYGGTKFDAEVISDSFGEFSSDDGQHKNWGSIIWPFALIDLPMSFIADTLLLPYTITNSYDDADTQK